MKQEHDANSNRDEKARRKKLSYTAPRLIEYGDIAKLTAGGAGTSSDGSGTKLHTMCL